MTRMGIPKRQAQGQAGTIGTAMTIERAAVQQTVFAVVEELLDAIDSEYEEAVSDTTWLIADGGFSSIDFVQMTVMIEEQLGSKIGFQDMLMQQGQYVDDLTVGQVVDFTVDRLTHPQAAQATAPTAAPAAAPVDVTGPRVTEEDVAAFSRLIKPRRVLPATGTKNKRAVFILSPPRSGSTLLRVMLAGNPALFAPPELHLLSYATMNERREDLSNEHSEHLLDGTVRALMQTRGWTGDQARRFIADCEDSGMSTREFFGVIQAELGERLLVDKTPTYAFSEDILRQAEACFDDALYIHLTRHPCGMIRSYEESNLTRMMPLLMKNSEFSMSALAEMIWLVSNRNILSFGESVPAERWFSVSYEQVVSQPEPSMRRLCQFLDVDYHPDMINPYSDSKSRMTDGVDSASKMSGDLKFHLHSQIDPNAATRWQQFCSEDMLGAQTLDLVANLDSSPARVRL